MNKIFKIIFSQSLGCMVIVSENAKSAGKSDNTTGTLPNTDNVKMHSSVSKVFSLQNIALSIALITGSNVWAGSVCDAMGNGVTGSSTAIGADAFTCGINNQASGVSSIALGVSNKAKGGYSFASGSHNLSQQNGSTAVGAATGYNYFWSKDNGTVIQTINGIGVTATGLTFDTITAINGQSVTQQDVTDFIATIGKGGSIAFGMNSTTVGNQNIAVGTHSTAIGIRNVAGDISTAIGHNNTATGNSSTAVGQANIASGPLSTSVGANNQSTSDHSSTFGSGNQAAGQFSSAIGALNKALKNNSNAFGYSNSAEAVYSSAFGSANIASGVRSGAVGYNNTATGLNSSAFGHTNKAEVQSSIAFGIGNTASGVESSAVGNQNQASGYQSVAIGSLNKASGLYSTAVGVSSEVLTTASNSTAIGYKSLADEANTVSFGRSGQEKRLTNVASGTKNTDAVNKKQMDDSVAIVNNRVTANSLDISNLQQGVGSLNASVVSYDDPTTKDKITLAGISGATISNLKAGDISSASSTEAVTGGQLFTTNESVRTLDARVTNDINTLDGRVTTNELDISDLQQDVGALNASVVSYDDSTTKDKITLAGISGTTISNLKAGDISSASSTEAVTGGQLFTTNQNVTTLDTRVTNDINTLDGRVTTNELDIIDLQQDVGSLNASVVSYDDSTTKDKITLAGVSGTTISNLEAGDISSASSTEAVTGGQLFTTNQNVSMVMAQVDSNANQTASILGGGASFNNGVFTLPNYSIQGQNYSNVGGAFGAVNNELSSIKGSVVDLKNYVDQQNQIVLDQSKTYTNQNGQALNSAAKDYVDQSIASSNQQTQNYTDQSIASSNQQTQQYTDQKIAGLHAQIKEDGKFINVAGSPTGLSGNNNGNKGASVTGDNSLALGINASVQGENSIAIGYGAQVVGDSSISVGDRNQVKGNGSGTFGDPNVVVGNGSYVIGNDNTVKADNTFVLGNNVNTEAKNAVILGNNSTSTRDNSVSVGTKDSERQIIHVADATEATDAVNLRQMQAANTETLKTSKDYTDTRISGLESSFTDFSLQTERRFKEVDKRFDRQGAMSSAMMNMATSTSGLKGLNRVGVGAGFQGGETAVAVGYQRIVSDNVSLSFGGAFTEDESSGGAGVGFSW